MPFIPIATIRKLVIPLLIFAAVLLNFIFLSRFYESHTNSTYFRSDMGQIFLQPPPTHARTLTQTLPCFAIDDSEYFIGSVLETSLHRHYIVLFMMSHLALSRSEDRNVGPDRVHKNFLKRWNDAKLAFSGVPYARGARRDAYHCRVSHNIQVVTALGTFVKNSYSQLTAVGDVDILRCPLPSSLITTGSAMIEIIRNDVSLVNYSIPLAHRRSGYLLPPSTFNAWSQPMSTQGPHAAALIYGLFSPLHARLVAYLLQLIQHHISTGFSHVFLFTSYATQSTDFVKLTLICRYFIDAQQLTIISEAFDNIDRVASNHMLTWHKASLLNLRSNMYLYLLKHHFDYMGVWHMDQFYLPKAPYLQVNDVLRSLDKIECTYIVATDLVIERNPNKKYDFMYPWLDRKYNDSITLHLNVSEYGVIVNTHAAHHVMFPYAVECGGGGSLFPDALSTPLLEYKPTSVMRDAVMYVFEVKHKGHENEDTIFSNDYNARYAQRVNSNLRGSNLDLLAQLLLSEEEQVLGINSEKWPKFATQ